MICVNKISALSVYNDAPRQEHRAYGMITPHIPTALGIHCSLKLALPSNRPRMEIMALA